MDRDQENNNSIELKTTRQRKLCYGDLLSRLEDIQESEDLGIEAINELDGILQRANILNDACDIRQRVQYVDETLLDASVISVAGSTLVKCVAAVDVSTATYEAAEFCRKLNEVVQEDEDVQVTDLLKLLDSARDIILEVPQCSYLFGSYDFTKIPQPKERIQKNRVKENVTKKQLTQVTNAEKDESGILNVLNVLVNVLQEEYGKNNKEPIDYYTFVIDSSDFGLTVENIFHCSLLMREGKAKLSVGDEGIPKLEPVHRNQLKQFRNSNGVNTQMITSITMEDWQKSNVTKGFLQQYREKSNGRGQ